MEMPRERKYTYDDYRGWDDGQRYELIDGEAYMMSPAPSRAHQWVSVSLVSQLYSYLKGKSCEVYSAPFDVRLDDNTVVQPDISVICDPGKLDERGCNGAPDMIVEILSPSSASHDQVVKFGKYRQAGVREYWMVNLEARTVQVYLLRDGEYISRGYDEVAVVPVEVLEDCQIDLAEVFPPGAPVEEAGKGPEGVLG